MTTENIFSGLKVVDLSSFIAGPVRCRDLVRFWRGRYKGRTSDG